MPSTKKQLAFNIENLTVTFDNNVIIDLNGVPHPAEAKLYSGVTSDFKGIDLAFEVVDSTNPFHLCFTKLTVTGFVLALIENRLELEGMVVDERILEAYDYIIDRCDFTARLYTGTNLGFSNC